MQFVMKSLTIILACLLHSPNLGTAGFSLFGYQVGKCSVEISEVAFSMIGGQLKRLLQKQPAPNVPQATLLQYDLYTRLNPEERQLLRKNDVNSLKSSNFNAKWPVRISIHGWGGSSTSCSNAAVKDAYLSRGDYNVIILDWSIQSRDLSYPRVSTQLQSIAASLAKFIKFLHEKTGMPFENVYLVGHSAGSHISGLTGKALRPHRLGAIFALDPAGLVQIYLGPEERLAPNDAIYVESIHSDVTLLGNPFGNRLSQASFFTNWGLGQPHCPNATATEFDFVCDHFAALYYFVESVRQPKLFGAIRCKSLDEIPSATCRCAGGESPTKCKAEVYMGGEPAVPKKGIYYLSTRRQVPFGYLDGFVHINKPLKSTVEEVRKSH